uniref:Uncharacterized protein n=1 Tax=Amphimedon queenslandica TaxID=400682 RepID=A0A1X7V913_AMPQE
MDRTPQFGRHSNQLSAPRKISDVSPLYRSPSPIPLRFYRKISSSKSPTPMAVDEGISDTNSVSFLSAVSERLKASPRLINKEISEEEEERDNDVMSDDEDMANVSLAASGRRRLSSLKQFKTLGNVKFSPDVGFRETIDKEDDKRKGGAVRRLGAQNTFYKKQGTVFSSHSDSEEDDDDDGEMEDENKHDSGEEEDDHDDHEGSLMPFTLPTIVKTSPEVKRRLSSPHVSESVIEKPIPVPVDSESRITRTDSNTVKSCNFIPSPKTAFRLSPKVNPIPHLRITDEHKSTLDSPSLVPENESFSPDAYERPESPEIIVAAISDESSFNEELKLISKPKLMMAEEPGHAWAGETRFSTGSMDETSFITKETSLRHSLPVGSQTTAMSGSLSLEDVSLEDAIESVSLKPSQIQNNGSPPSPEPVTETDNIDEDTRTYSGSLASHVPAGYMAGSLINDTQLKSLMTVPPDQVQLQRHRSLSPDYSNKVGSYYPRKYSERSNSLSPVDNVARDGQGSIKRGSFRSLSLLEKERVSFYADQHRSLSPLEREMLYDSNPSLRRHSLSPAHFSSSTHPNSLSSPSSPLHSNENSASACDHVPLPSSPTYERPLSATDHTHISQSDHTSFNSSIYYQRPLSAFDYSSLPSERTRQPTTSPRHRSLSPLYSKTEGNSSHSMGYKRHLKSPQKEGEQADQATTPSDLSTAFLNFQKRAKNKLLHENQHKL